MRYKDLYYDAWGAWARDLGAVGEDAIYVIETAWMPGHIDGDRFVITNTVHVHKQGVIHRRTQLKMPNESHEDCENEAWMEMVYDLLKEGAHKKYEFINEASQ